MSCYDKCMGCVGCGSILGAAGGMVGGGISGYKLTQALTDSTVASVASVIPSTIGGGMLGWLVGGFVFIGAAYVVNNFPSRSSSRSKGATFRKKDLETAIAELDQKENVAKPDTDSS